MLSSKAFAVPQDISMSMDYVHKREHGMVSDCSLIVLLVAIQYLCHRKQGIESGCQIRPLDIPELLELILKHCENQELARSAIVCRAWELPALKVLWHKMAKPQHLFALLGDLVQTKNNLVSRFICNILEYAADRLYTK